MFAKKRVGNLSQHKTRPFGAELLVESDWAYLGSEYKMSPSPNLWLLSLFIL